MISKIEDVQDFLKERKRWMYVALPALVPLLGMTVAVTKYLVADNAASARVFFEFFMLYLLLLIWYLYMWAFAAKLGLKNVNRGLNTYLNGEKFWHYENGGFTELGYYLGHGLCYEAAAMLMLVWQDWKQTRFVCGEAYSDTLQDMVPHAWMEVKAYGVWWVIDAGWFSPSHPVPRIWYILTEQAKVTQIIEHSEFFSHKTARDLANAIRNPDTSMCLHKLSNFSRNLAPLD